MKTSKRPTLGTGGDHSEPVDKELAKQLKRIETEDTPERLLALARELQTLLRDKT